MQEKKNMLKWPQVWGSALLHHLPSALQVEASQTVKEGSLSAGAAPGEAGVSLQLLPPWLMPQTYFTGGPFLTFLALALEEI